MILLPIYSFKTQARASKILILSAKKGRKALMKLLLHHTVGESSLVSDGGAADSVPKGGGTKELHKDATNSYSATPQDLGQIMKEVESKL